MHKDFSKRLEEQKSEAVLQVLLKTARLVNERALSTWNATRRGKSNIRASHMALLPHLDLEGTRMTTLADQLGVSKQAVGQLVTELEEMKLIKRTPDPTDGRAKLIHFTKRGLESMMEGLGVLKDLEQHLTRKLGERRMAEFAETLALILLFVEANPTQHDSPDDHFSDSSC